MMAASYPYVDGRVSCKLIRIDDTMCRQSDPNDPQNAGPPQGDAATPDTTFARDPAMPDTALFSEETCGPAEPETDLDRVRVPSTPSGGGEIITQPDNDDRMLVGAETHASPGPGLIGLELELGILAPQDILVPYPNPDPPRDSNSPPHARDDPLTLSQLSPRKRLAVVAEDGNGNAENAVVTVGREGTVSPMRPSVKRPASVAPVEPVERSHKRSAHGIPPFPGRYGARVVSAPAQIRRQPAKKAREAQPTAAPRSAVSASTRPARIAARSTNAVPEIKNRRKKLPSVASFSNAGNATIPVKFNFPDAGLGAHLAEAQPDPVHTGASSDETQPRPKAYTIPDFKAMHASQAAQSALRRGHLVPTVPVPIVFSTDARVKERELFDQKVRERERELEAAREVQRREREEEEAKEIKEMRKHAIPKAHEVPEWYKEAPRRNNDDEAGQ
ncbi:hypothetical protein B0H13DRAFT_1971219 [Mycena leptocephala]|nr:hypothetical protein B0H13DRAFT_1971219 [Mycena leptocephala]